MDPRPSVAKRFWRRCLLQRRCIRRNSSRCSSCCCLPLAALIVSFIATIIGIVTFGIFAPALIGLAFLDLRSLPLGLPIFVLTCWSAGACACC